MATAYGKHFSTKRTPQTEAMREDQVQNSAGGFVWQISGWDRLDRFLILGTEGGTYYASERKLSRENAKSIVGLINEDGVRVVSRIVEISDQGRAYKNDAALFVLALCASTGDAATKQAAEEALPKVARIGTHLFTFMEYVNSLRGWGRSLKRMVANWYQNRTPLALAKQVTKYAQRDGWSHRDVLRLAKPKPNDSERGLVYAYAAKGADVAFPKFAESTQSDSPAFNYLSAVEKVKKATGQDMIGLIREYQLPREVLPTEALTNVEVWRALFEKMPMTAMIRNLATMTRVGLIAPMKDVTAEVVRRLGDVKLLKEARTHPIQVLAALVTYSSGKGARGQNTWTPVQQVVDALDKAFYLSFAAVDPTGASIMFGVDCSGSMDGGTICGVPGLTPRHGAAAMAMTIANTEANYSIWGFGNSKIDPLPISPRQRLDNAMQIMNRFNWGGTDCALPMMRALNDKMEVDAFIVITDNETWAGRIHPSQALKEYRQKMSRPKAKLIVVGMTATDFSIADPQDPGMLDVVGFDTNAPTIIADFIRG